jgi:hypothetical protein
MGMNEVRTSHCRVQAIRASRGAGARAVGAQAPEGHFGLFDEESGIMRGNQARSVTDRAVDIDDETARTAHQVVMVVPDPPLVPCNRTGRLDAAEEPDLGEGVERIVDGLMRDRRKRPTDRADDGLGVGMRMILHGLEHRSPLLRHTQRSLPQCRCSILDVSMIRSVHTTRMPRSFERVKERSEHHRRGGRRGQGRAGRVAYARSPSPRRPPRSGTCRPGRVRAQSRTGYGDFDQTRGGGIFFKATDCVICVVE